MHLKLQTAQGKGKFKRKAPGFIFFFDAALQQPSVLPWGFLCAPMLATGLPSNSNNPCTFSMKCLPPGCSPPAQQYYTSLFFVFSTSLFPKWRGDPRYLHFTSSSTLLIVHSEQILSLSSPTWPTVIWTPGTLLLHLANTPTIVSPKDACSPWTSWALSL